MFAYWFVTDRLVKATKAVMKEWDEADCRRAFGVWAQAQNDMTTSESLAMPQAPAGLLQTITDIFMCHVEGITCFGIPINIVFDGTAPVAKGRARKIRNHDECVPVCDFSCNRHVVDCAHAVTARARQKRAQDALGHWRTGNIAKGVFV